MLTAVKAKGMATDVMEWDLGREITKRKGTLDGDDSATPFYAAAGVALFDNNKIHYLARRSP